MWWTAITSCWLTTVSIAEWVTLWPPILSRTTMSLSERVASVQLTVRKRELWTIKLGCPPSTTEHPRMLTSTVSYCWGRREGSHKGVWIYINSRQGHLTHDPFQLAIQNSCLPTGDHNDHFGFVRTPTSQSSSLATLEPISGGLSGLLQREV